MRSEVLNWSHSSGESIWEPYLELFKNSPVSDEEFSHLLKNSSENFKRHKDSHYNPVRTCLNSIHNKNKLEDRNTSKNDNDFLNEKNINFKKFLLRLEKSPMTQDTYQKLIKSNNTIASFVPSQKLFQNIRSIANTLHDRNKYIKQNDVTPSNDFLSKEKKTDDLDERVAKSKNDNPQVRKNRLRTASKKAEKIQITSVGYKRNPDVIAEVLLRSNGICEKCDKKAPFVRKKDNSPYLEVHHKIMLSNGGDDSVENAIALCPNCHRELHFGV